MCRLACIGKLCASPRFARPCDPAASSAWWRTLLPEQIAWIAWARGASTDGLVGIVVDDLAATIEFFRELGLELEGQALVEGEWAGRATGLGDQRVEIAMMRTPDGHSRLELSRFITPLWSPITGLLR
jgi:hypothetical protein